MKTLFVISIFFLSTALYADWDNEQKLTASDGASYDHFAYVVSLLALIGMMIMNIIPVLPISFTKAEPFGQSRPR